jgi:hypothetical protein
MSVLLYRETKYFDKINLLCEQIEKDGKKFPAQYFDKNWHKALDIDKVNGTAYWRLNGVVRNTPETDLVANNILIGMTIPLKLVAFVPYSKFKKDNSYRELNMAAEIQKVLTGTFPTLRRALKAQKLTAFATSYNTNRDNVWSEETEGLNKPKFEFAIVSIELDVKLEISKDCIQTENVYSETGDFNIVDFDPRDFKI